MRMTDLIDRLLRACGLVRASEAATLRARVVTLETMLLACQKRCAAMRKRTVAKVRP